MAARGQFIQGNSIAHKLDPRIKLIFNIALIVLVFTTNSFIMQGMLVTPIAFFYLQAGMKVKGLLRTFKRIVFIWVILMIANMAILMPESTDPWVDGGFNSIARPKYSWGIFALTYHALMQTTLIAFRIYTMILTTTLLTISTKPMALTRSVEDLLSPLKLIKVPVHVIAMIMSIALRFIPTLMSEAQRIMKAQASRGADYINGGLKSKVKSMVTLIIPLFVSAFIKAEDLGNAMETRGYDPYEKRTRYREYPIRIMDIIALFIIGGFITMIVLTNNGTIMLPEWENWG